MMVLTGPERLPGRAIAARIVPVRSCCVWFRTVTCHAFTARVRAGWDD